MKCKSVADHQAFSQEGPLARNANLQLNELHARLVADRGTVYCYVIATIEEQNGRLVQTGSGPNFQGELVTLCTCKHRMRTSMSPDEWVGKWIAGFTGVGPGRGRNYLFFLMRVGQAFESHRELWCADTIPRETKQAKAADANVLGDLYRPRSATGNPFDPRDYVPPCPEHVHCKDSHWHDDIDYVGFSDRVAALLVGDPERSFLWNRRMTCFASRVPRGPKKVELTDLVSQLREDETLRVWAVASHYWITRAYKLSS